MREDEYQQYDAMGLARLIASGEVSARTVCETAIRLIEEKNQKLNAVVVTDFERALRRLDKIPSEAPLAGVPYLVKDFNTHVAGLPSTNGSVALRHFVPKHDADLVKRIFESGLVILGKTNTPEFGLNICTAPKLYGATPNPHNPEYSAGGSSGGSACAVACGMVPAAHATDSGGSIRIPAANCGLFGLKPSRARVPLGNDMAEGLAGFSTAHAVTHSVRDSAVLLDLTTGSMPGDIYAAPPVKDTFLGALDSDWQPLRVAIWRDGFAGETVHPACRDAVDKAGTLCASWGCPVEEARPEFDGEELRRSMDILFSANIGVIVKAMIDAHPGESPQSIVEPATLDAAQHARGFSAADYAAAQLHIQGVARSLGRFFQRFDVLLTPTLANPPLRLGALSMANPDWSEYFARLLDEIPFTPLFNATGAPAASIPMHQHNGLPVGVHAGTKYGGEKTLLRLARQFELTASWHSRQIDG